MKNIYLFFALLLSSVFALAAEQADFSCTGYAALNGGTTGGEGGEIVDVHTYDELQAAAGGEKDVTKRVIRIHGKIEVAGGGEPIAIGSNKTFVGVGNTAFISQIEFYVKNASNIIIQNIKFSAIGSGKGSSADLISIATTGSKKCSNIWIDHCEFYNVTPIRNPSASLKDKYDGMVDVKGDSEYITISWCYFHDHYKACLFGFSEGKDRYDRKVTFHHNVFERVNSRLPSLRYGTAHIYNNYYIGTQDDQGWFGSGPNIRDTATARVEANYFKGCDHTIYSMDTPLPGSWCAREGYDNMWDNNSIAPTAKYEEDCFILPAGYTEQLHKVEDLVEVLKVGTTVGVGVVGPETVPGADGNSSSNGIDSNTGNTGHGTGDGDGSGSEGDGDDSSLTEGESVFENTDSDGYLWFNSANENYVTALINGGQIVLANSETSDGSSSSFNPAKVGAGTDGASGTAGAHTGALELAKAKDKGARGGNIVFKLPGCSLMKLVFSRTGDIYAGVEISSDEGASWAATAQSTGTKLSGKGIYTADFTKYAQSSTPVWVRIVNGGTGSLLIHAASIKTALDGETSISKDNVVKSIVSTRYYNLSGIQVNQPDANTIYIQENVYDDGSVERAKLINK